MTRAPVRAFQVSHSAARRLDRAVRKVLDVTRAVHSGAWLGAMSSDALAALDEATYDGSYAYHATDEHNLRGLFRWEELALERHFPKSGRLLVTSAGGGREVIALLERGYEVEAFECNAQLRAAANDLLRRRGLPGEVLQAPRDGWVDTGETYDGIVVGWGSYTNIRGRSRRVRLIRGLHGLANDAAPLLVSYYLRAAQARSFDVAAVVGNHVASLLGREGVEVGDVVDPTFQHYFSEDEVREELMTGGWRCLEASREGYCHTVALAAPVVSG